MNVDPTRHTVVIIQARMTSTRLPGKVMLRLGPGTVLDCVLRRAYRIPGIDQVCLAVPEGEEHQPILDVAAGYEGLSVVRGPEADVLRRYAIAAEATEADFVVRVTSDCPLIDPAVSGAVVATAHATNACARTSFETGFPLGLDTEAMPVGLLFEADRRATEAAEREHVTPFIWRQPNRFPVTYIDRRPDRRAWRLTLDTQADYELIRAVYEALGRDDPCFDFKAIEALLNEHPELAELNTQ